MIDSLHLAHVLEHANDPYNRWIRIRDLDVGYV